jgi:microcystin-dependent protein
MMMFGGAAAPSGWLLCHGQSLVRADYPDLFGVIGTLFGSVDSTHFNVPDMRHRLPIGANADGATVFDLGANDGRADGTARSDSHSHSHTHTTNTTGSSHTHNIPGQPTGGNTYDNASGSANRLAPRNGVFEGHAHGGDTGSTGSGHTHGVTTNTGIADTTTSAHAWTAVHYIIKT